MKKIILEFLHRGAIACGLGPVIFAIVCLILQKQAGVESLTVNQLCMGIFSLSALAFIAGGMNMIYQMEQLPLMAAILIHGIVLYLSYLVTYQVNGWLEGETTPLLIFSAIFVLGYLIIWVIIYCITKRKTEKLNRSLKKKH